MSAPGRTKRKPLPPELSVLRPKPDPNKAATKIQKVFRGFSARNKHFQRLGDLVDAGQQAYEKLRVYHGTHEENAKGILDKGLVPQGGKGLIGMIGHTTESQGKVFFTRDKEQAAYYALTVSGMAKHDRIQEARKANDLQAEQLAMQKPPKPTVLRMLLPESVQQQAVHDDKGDKHDFTLKQKVAPGFLLPGHLQPVADVTQQREAVTLFQSEMNKSGVKATPFEAAATLNHLRRKSISGDVQALQSPHAVESAKAALDDYRLKTTF